jgi:hypothetical protein
MDPASGRVLSFYHGNIYYPALPPPGGAVFSPEVLLFRFKESSPKRLVEITAMAGREIKIQELSS